MRINWIEDNGNWYYLNEKGVMLKEWQKINGVWYYFLNNGQMAKGWQKVNQTWYLLDNNGAMITGWYFQGDNWYYLEDWGGMSTGWKSINDNWYFLNKNTGAMVIGWYSYGYKWYYFLENGEMARGWNGINGNWYYLNHNGTMKTGWISDGLHWYYLDNLGKILHSDFYSIDGNTYYLYDNGAMATNTWFGAKYARPNGSVVDANSYISHSNLQYNLFKYMTNANNEEDVHATSIKLHGGIIYNNCTYFVSEALRRVGVNVPRSMASVLNLEKYISSRGWVRCTDFTKMKPGDILFSGQAHTYIFMGWIDNNYAYIVDNQKRTFGSVLHPRLITGYEEKYDSNPTTHFYYWNN